MNWASLILNKPEKSDVHKQEKQWERNKCIITTYADLKNVIDFEIRRELD